MNLVVSAKRLKNLSNDQFVKLITVFLGLPPTFDRGNAQVVEGFDYPIESCMGVHDKQSTHYLDANADHHSGSCPSAALNVCRRHSNLTTVVMKYALEAGAVPTRTHPLYFMPRVSLQRTCGRIFPKNVTTDYKKKSAEIVLPVARRSG